MIKDIQPIRKDSKQYFRPGTTFSTIDMDRDYLPNQHCAKLHGGGEFFCIYFAVCLLFFSYIFIYCIYLQVGGSVEMKTVEKVFSTASILNLKKIPKTKIQNYYLFGVKQNYNNLSCSYRNQMILTFFK